jgi:carbonic anhydrase
VDDTADASAMQPIFDAMKNMAVDSITTLRTKIVNLNFFKIFPEDRENKMKFYYYEGSYTAPDCNENVKWALIYEPLKITQAQVIIIFI